jgi:hypothetical protein
MVFTIAQGCGYEITTARSQHGYKIINLRAADRPYDASCLGVLIDGKPHAWSDQLDTIATQYMKAVKTVAARSMTSTFQEQWGFPNEVMNTIKDARSYIVENTTLKFRTGRAIIHVVFYDAKRNEICRRTGMRLQSKAGKPYEVCARDAPAPPSDLGLDDVFA